MLVHGDAAFAGQGIVAETLNLSDLKGYTVGGTVHIIVNNLLGFTTLYKRRALVALFGATGPPPVDSDFSRQCGRCGRCGARGPPGSRLSLHLEGDVVVDLIGYRRHGHSEVDDPTVTQPLLYKAIKDHPPLWEIYAEDIGAENVQQKAEKVRAELEAAQKKSQDHQKEAAAARAAELLG